jgi:hypothetical protein
MGDMNIYIFGDSFAATHCYKTHHLFEYTWPRKLENAFNVTNYARAGSGPQYTCEKIHNLTHLNDLDLNNSIAIIILSDISRYNFSFYDFPSDHVFGQYNNDVDKNSFFEQDFRKKYGQQQIEFVKNFRSYYLEHSQNWALEETKYLSYFDNVAKRFKQTLVWSTNPLLSSGYRYSNIDIAPIDLNKIASHEFPEGHYYGFDNRPNHLSIANHNIMLEQLYNWIVNKASIEDKFLKE